MLLLLTNGSTHRPRNRDLSRFSLTCAARQLGARQEREEQDRTHGLPEIETVRTNDRELVISSEFASMPGPFVGRYPSG